MPLPTHHLPPDPGSWTPARATLSNASDVAMEPAMPRNMSQDLDAANGDLLSIWLKERAERDAEGSERIEGLVLDLITAIIQSNAATKTQLEESTRVLKTIQDALSALLTTHRVSAPLPPRPTQPTTSLESSTWATVTKTQIPRQIAPSAPKPLPTQRALNDLKPSQTMI